MIERPVFIMGPHRSGTTILYKVLADTRLFNVVTLFHVLHHDRLTEMQRPATEAAARGRLVERLAQNGLTDRQFDSMPISPDLPEEYAWILERQGRRPRLSAQNLKGFTAFCRAVCALQQPRQRLLLKNPHDADNFLFIQEALPQAKFVFIHRDPVAVVSSQIRAITSMLERRNEYVALVVGRYRRLYQQPLKLALARTVYSRRWPLLLWHIERNLTRTNTRIVEHADRLGSSAIAVTYPQLCAKPAETLAGILAFLDLPSPDPPRVAAPVQPRNPALLPEVRAREAVIRRRNAAYCARFGL
jgi:hypothetical protein